jgi:hypothetical protein
MVASPWRGVNEKYGKNMDFVGGRGYTRGMRIPPAVLLLVVTLAACKKEAPPAALAPVQGPTDAVPISNDPRQGAQMIDAAKRAAVVVGADEAKREAGAKEALGE